MMSFKQILSETRCHLESEKLFAVGLEKVQKLAGTWGLGECSSENTCGQVWQLLGFCGANVALETDTEAARRDKVLQRY